jgi:hypothetical protein
MKKLFLALLACAFVHALQAQTQVTLRVDMSNTPVDGVVNLAGDMMDEAGLGTDWSPADPGNELADPDGDGIWEITFTVAPGNYQYKFVNGDAGWETIPSGCAFNGNRELIVGGAPVTQQFCFNTCDFECSTTVDVDVTFQVNTVGTGIDTVILAGSFGAAGLPNWDGDGDGSIYLTDPDGDGLFTTTQTLPTGTYQYKLLNGPNGWETVPCDCQVSGNREVVVGTTSPLVLAPVYIGDCDNTFNGDDPVDVTFSVDMSGTSLGPGGLFVAGSFQSPAWQKNVTQLTDPDGDEIYTVTVPILPGEFEYKFYNGDFTQAPDPSNTDYYAEAGTLYGFYDFRTNGCGCEGAGFNNRLLNVEGAAPITLPTYIFNSCESITATNDLSTAANVRLFPNPMSGSAYLEFEGAAENRHTAVVTDGLGRQVRSYAAFAGQQLRIEKGLLAPGFYLVTLRNEKGESATVKLSVQ